MRVWVCGRKWWVSVLREVGVYVCWGVGGYISWGSGWVYMLREVGVYVGGSGRVCMLGKWVCMYVGGTGCVCWGMLGK